MKKVLLLIIDAFNARITEPAIRNGRLPNLERLIDAGQVHWECLSIFPSITPAATASLATGVYPAEHQVAGAFWYDEAKAKVAYYGDDFWTLVNHGFGTFVQDYLVTLNRDRLKSETIFETVERAGMQAAVFNYMWFRGDARHTVDVPLLLKLLPGLEFAPEIAGPQIIGLADFVRSEIPGRGVPFSATGGLPRRYGFHDETTIDYLMEWATADPLPDFTLAYCPNNDFESHDRGPYEALDVVERIDERLGELFEAFGGLERMLNEFTIVITGDHSQGNVDSKHRGDVDLDEVLAEYQLVPAGSDWRSADDLMVCPNMRAAHLYFHTRPAKQEFRRVIDQLLTCPRVDQVMWQTDDDDGRRRNRVVTVDRGEMSFTAARDGDPDAVHDHFGNHWLVEGDLAVLDAVIHEDNLLTSETYPNALERIAQGFCDKCGSILATAVEGSEFCLPATENHQMGSHGSLHRLDSVVPLIIAGAPNGMTIPEHVRIVDVAGICLDVLGIDRGG